MDQFTTRVATVGGLILTAMAIAAVVWLALDRIIDGATAVATILGISGFAGGTAVAHRAVTSESNSDSHATVGR